MQQAFQPSSRSNVLDGTSDVKHTSEFSSSVFPVKQYSASAFTELAAFGNTTEKGIPPTNDICFKYISIAVAIGIPKV